MSASIAFGWGAAPFAEQLPALPQDKAEAFDADNKAITRLSVRGLLTEAERDRAIRRTTREIKRALASGTAARRAEGNQDGE